MHVAAAETAGASAVSLPGKLNVILSIFPFHLHNCCSWHRLFPQLSCPRACVSPIFHAALSVPDVVLTMRRVATLLARQSTKASNAAWQEALPDCLHAASPLGGVLAHQTMTPMFRVLRTVAPWPVEQLQQQQEAPPAAAAPARGFAAEAAASNLAPCERPPVEQQANDLDSALTAAAGQGPAAVLALVEAHGEQFTEQNVITALKAVAEACAGAPSSSAEDLVRSEWYQALVDMVLAG